MTGKPCFPTSVMPRLELERGSSTVVVLQRKYIQNCAVPARMPPRLRLNVCNGALLTTDLLHLQSPAQLLLLSSRALPHTDT